MTELENARPADLYFHHLPLGEEIAQKLQLGRKPR
jgi:hypothetical protein